ncbi:competence type IV pilus major pilin ComGC [Enterococcus lemanii]|jgi:competence protein ComGC|uniref:Competence type IV pilus major pilin ComGC n=1 Tax=Enterococcus lemanii TaxID=1159752 RepID=A0ABV9MXB4_9ENTE|nr:competence type IV pilus major pilin ComGC [Enterococcus lemanii]MBM7710402.1 competence protein ComGC [Enterococcus lemanii]NLM66079.1 prepilin-type N-terminal cleavage/methylation domain-containing protein [Enterococcus sp.]
MRKKGTKKRYSAFTLLEMMIVLLIISVLILLFIPNLSSQKDSIINKSDQAIAETIITEIELVKFDKDGKIDESDIEKILGENTKKQEVYEKYVKGKLELP